MSVIHVGNHLPSLVDKLPLRHPFHAVKKVGHEAVKTALATVETAKLEFNGRHALTKERPEGKTTYELGATTLRLPFIKEPPHTPHTPNKPAAKSVEKIREGIVAAELQYTPALDPDYLYTQPDITPKIKKTPR